MKKIITLYLMLIVGLSGYGQQIIPIQKTVNVKELISQRINKQVKVARMDILDSFSIKQDSLRILQDSVEFETSSIEVVETDRTKKERFGVFGVGNLNKEQLEKFNASGKFSCFVRPVIREKNDLTFYLSFNKNATNNDSLLASTLIFPEVGNSSFIGTAEYSFLIHKKENDINAKHYLIPFIEFSNKNIKASQDTGNAKTVTRHFSTINSTLGLKYLFHYKKQKDQEVNNVYFSLAGYVSYLNVPNQDTADYRILLKSPTITDNFWTLGVKVAVQYNNFSIFADFRHVLGSEFRIPVRELRGFNSNIGVVFNAEIFGL